MKALSHVYVANAMINDVLAHNGKVQIGNLGLFDIRPEFKAALLDRANHPFVRTGSVGPDAFPSLLTGQTQIHSFTDKWLAYIDSRMHITDLQKIALNKSLSEKNAFFIGYLSHVCADIWTHDWVNSYSGGPWPEFSKIGTPEGLRNISIHLAIETIMDDNVKRVKGSMPVDVKVPTNALVDLLVNTKRVPVLADDETLGKDDISCSSFLEDGFAKKYWFTEQYLGASNANPFSSYFREWHKDLKNGLVRWVNAHRNAIEAHFISDEDLFSALKEEWLGWAKWNLLSMYGAPDILVKLPAAILDMLDISIPFLEKIKDQIKDEIYDYICKQAFGMTYDDLKQRITPASLQALINNSSTFNKIISECGNIPPLNQFSSNSNPIFLNSLIFSKIALMPLSEQRRLATICGQALGNKVVPLPYYAMTIDGSGQFKHGIVMSKLTQGLFNKNVLKHFDKYRVLSQSPKPHNSRKRSEVVETLKSISVKVRTADKLWAGTNADIYFGLKFKDGVKAEWLLDQSYYDDLERGDDDWYHFFSTIPAKRKSDIQSIFLLMKNKDGPGPDWRCSRIRVCINGDNTQTFSVNKEFTKAGEIWTKTVNFSHSLNGYEDDDEYEDNSIQDTSLQEDCVKFNYRHLRVTNFSERWKIVEGSHWLMDFGKSESEARQALKIIQHYQMEERCFVGRPNPSMTYFLSDGEAPKGSMRGEDCTPFNPLNLEVRSISGRWKIVEGSHWLMDFGNKADEAKTALQIIKKYGFNRLCFVGRPSPSMTYFRS